MFYCRKLEKKTVFAPVYKYLRKRITDRSGLEIETNNIAGGIYLVHAFCIAINPNCVIGKNVNLHKGVTIGAENRGKRKGYPTLGNQVWVGANATIVGAVTIGDDVLIAPNSYVNFDVPSHSVVIGNPAKIVSRDNATQGYINNLV